MCLNTSYLDGSPLVRLDGDSKSHPQITGSWLRCSEMTQKPPRLKPAMERKLLEYQHHDFSPHTSRECQPWKKKPLCQNRYLQLPTTSQMASGERFYGQMRQRLNCFVTMKREMFEARPGFQTEQQSTNCQYNVGSVILCRCLAAWYIMKKKDYLQIL